MSNTDRILRWGIVGCGKIAEDFANVLQQYPDQHKIRAVAASDEQRARKFCEKVGAEKAYGDYDLFLKNERENIDIVYVGSVHTAHCERTVQCLNAGYNVLCEKPLGVNAGEVQKMVDAAKRNDRFLMEAFWTRFFPTYDRLRKEVTGGTIGQPTVLSMNFNMLHDRKNLRVFDPACAGGATLDIGCYCVMLSNQVFGDGTGMLPEVKATARMDPQTGVDLACSITLSYPGKGFAQILYSIDTALQRRDAVVEGSKGYILIDDPMFAPERLTINGQVVDLPLPGREPKYPYNYDGRLREGFCYMLKCVRECLLTGQKECATMPLKDSILFAKITDEIRKQIGLRYKQDA